MSRVRLCATILAACLVVTVTSGVGEAFADDPESVSLTGSALSYNTNDATPTVAATVDPIFAVGDVLAVYDDTGQLRCQKDRYSGSCQSVSAPAPVNGTRTYVAYIVTGTAPSSGPPSNPVATSSPITISNVGYVNQGLTLTSPATSYTTNESPPTITAVVDPYMTGNYVMSVYDDTGALRCEADTYNNSCHFTATAPVNGTRTFTAYVAAGLPPSSGPPTDDVRATSAPVTIRNVGYVNDSLTLTASAASYTTNESPPTITAVVDPYMTGNYVMSVYDDTGALRCEADTYNNSCHFTATAPVNGTRTFTAYVAAGLPPSSGPPTDDVRVVSEVLAVSNLGWLGDLTFTANSAGSGRH